MRGSGLLAPTWALEIAPQILAYARSLGVMLPLVNAYGVARTRFAAFPAHGERIHGLRPAKTPRTQLQQGCEPQPQGIGPRALHKTVFDPQTTQIVRKSACFAVCLRNSSISDDE